MKKILILNILFITACANKPSPVDRKMAQEQSIKRGKAVLICVETPSSGNDLSDFMIRQRDNSFILVTQTQSESPLIAKSSGQRLSNELSDYYVVGSESLTKEVTILAGFLKYDDQAVILTLDDPQETTFRFEIKQQEEGYGPDTLQVKSSHKMHLKKIAKSLNLKALDKTGNSYGISGFGHCNIFNPAF